MEGEEDPVVDNVEPVEEAVPQDVELDAETEEEAPPEEVEIEFGGNRHKFRKDATVGELAEELNGLTKGAWSDYTKNSQEIAAARKALEEGQATLQKLSGMNEQIQDKYAHGLNIRAELEQFGKLDMNALWQSDPDQARQLSDHKAQLVSEFQRTVQEVNQLESQINNQRAVAAAAQANTGKQAVLKAIPDFEKSLPAVKEYAIKQGVPPEDAENWGANPIAAVAMWKAMQYDQIKAAGAKASQNRTVPVTPVVAMPSSGASSSPKLDLVKDAHKMTTEEWLRQRNSQLKRGK